MIHTRIIIGTGTVLNKKELVESLLKANFLSTDLALCTVSNDADEVIRIAQTTPHCVVLLEKTWKDAVLSTFIAHEIKRASYTAKVFQYTMHPFKGRDAHVFDGSVGLYPKNELLSFMESWKRPVREFVF